MSVVKKQYQSVPQSVDQDIENIIIAYMGSHPIAKLLYDSEYKNVYTGKVKIHLFSLLNSFCRYWHLPKRVRSQYKKLRKKYTVVCDTNYSDGVLVYARYISSPCVFFEYKNYD